MSTKTINLIWMALLAATGVTYWIGESGAPGSLGMGPVLVILALVLLKGLWVINDFMELRHAPALWRRIIIGWLLVVVMLIAVAYWMGLP